MQSNPECPPLDDVELLARSFAKCLIEKGFRIKDLANAANIMLEEALEIGMENSEEDHPPLNP